MRELGFGGGDAGATRVGSAAVAVVVLASLAVAPARAADVSFNGAIAERAQVVAPSELSLLSTKDLPIFSSLTEATLQGRARLLDEKLRFGVDASAFFSLSALYADADRTSGALGIIDDELDEGELGPVAPSDGARAFTALSEAWASAEPMEHLVLTAGKKRTVWGPALILPATDLLNPARDPTDPSLQRAGFWQARVDVPFERFTVTALVAPGVLEEQAALPTKLLWNDADDDDVIDDAEYHWAAALRGYALIGDADVNAWLLYSDRYTDQQDDEWRLALTLSQSLFTIHEFHAEVLLQQGSARFTVEPDCVEQQSSLALCGLVGRDIVHFELEDSERIWPRILVGWRTMPDDGSMIVVEYLYQSDGFLRAEYDDFARLLAFAGRFQREGVDLPVSTLAGGGGAGGTSSVPNRVSFRPQRRHYLAFSWTRPQLLGDFTLGLTAITPLEDLSVLASGSLTWQAQEWLQLSLLGFAPLPSPARASADTTGDPYQQLYESLDDSMRGFVPRGAVIGGKPVGEFDGTPFRAQLMFEARAFF